jgi:hypothetical protein
VLCFVDMIVSTSTTILNGQEIHWLKSQQVTEIMTRLEPYEWPALAVTFVDAAWPFKVTEQHRLYAYRTFKTAERRVTILLAFQDHFSHCAFEMFSLVEDYCHWHVDFVVSMSREIQATAQDQFFHALKVYTLVEQVPHHRHPTDRFSFQAEVIQTFLLCYHLCKLPRIPAALITFFLYPFYPTVYFEKPIC